MTEEKGSKEEPPDLRNLRFSTNGRSHENYVFRIEEAEDSNGSRFVRRIGTDRVYRVIRDGLYECVECGTQTDHVMVSQDVIPKDYGMQRQIRCQPIHYCPKCEPKPERMRLDVIHEEDLPKHL